jgi:hypothetical protein
MKFAAVLLATLLAAASEGDCAEQFTQQFGSEPINQRLLKRIGPEQALRPVRGGLAVTLPTEEKTQAGVETRFGLSGDFEITAGYEVPDHPPPETGYGLGVILRLNRVDSDDYIAFGRRIQRSGVPVFNANNSKLVGGQRKHDQTFHEAQSPRGELRIIRAGSLLRFLVKEEGDEEFRQIREVEFGDVPLKSVKYVGDTGGSQQKMTVRLTHLSVRSDGLPYGPTTVPGQHAWTTWKVFGAAGVLVLIGGGIWYWCKRAES